MVKPLSNGLVRVVPMRSADNLPVVAIAPNSLEYRLLPGIFFLQTTVFCVQGAGIISYLRVVVLEIGIILAQILDFLEVVFMCLGMRLVDASKFTGNTSTADA